MFAETLESIALVEIPTKKSWRDWAMESIHAVALRSSTFTSADVFTEMQKDPAITTQDNRAMGPMFIRAVRNGWIASTNVYAIDTARPWCHDQPRRIWKSQIATFEGAAQ